MIALCLSNSKDSHRTGLSKAHLYLMLAEKKSEMWWKIHWNEPKADPLLFAGLY